MRALHRKLLRDLWTIKGQAVAIALVIACGVAMLVAYLSTFDSLRRAQTAYYDAYRFADVFASLVRAPRSLENDLAEIPGVATAATRVVAGVLLDVPDLAEPAAGLLVSIPERARPELDDVFLRRGRWIAPERDEEVLVSEAFAEARGLDLGDTITAILNGRKRDLRIVGIALSPEHVYSIRPGELVPDAGRYAILWMGRRALAAAFDMEGGFNDVALRLVPGASVDDVIARLDRLLAPYGGRGAIPRALQLSHWTVDNELAQLQGMGLMIPAIFLTVAAFLLGVVLRRIVAVQREQIAALKALGYANREVGAHYAAWGLVIALGGGGLGLVFGARMGAGMLGMYEAYFRFPGLEQHIEPRVVLLALVVSAVAGLVGSQGAVRRAVSLPPAEAMRPESPPIFRRSLIERLGLERLLSQPARIVVRNLERQPARTAASILGIAFAGAMLIVGLFFVDAIEELMKLQFWSAQRQDVTVTFVEPLSPGALFELGRLPGVMRVEPTRAVAARLRHGHRSRRVGITGLVGDPALQRVVDIEGRPHTLPAEGLLMSRTLADVLDVTPGEEVEVEVLEGGRPRRRVRVAALADEMMGTAVYMEERALHRLMREGDVLSGAFLEVDPDQAEALYARLKLLPAVAGVSLKIAAIDNFRRTVAQNLGVMIFFNVLFAGVIAFGVVYNAARVSLSERSRELASLRVLGFTRGEISRILLGELATVTALAVPLGLVLGYGLAALLLEAVETELYRFPLTVSPRTYAFSAIVVTVAATISGLVVRRRLDHLDLVAVLKTRGE